MRRVCLDTESTFYWHTTWEWATPASVRAWLATKHDFQFHCAVVYDASRRRYYEYSASGIEWLIERLSNAEEIVTVNGSGCDLPVLERVCGQQAIERIWRVHRDLHGWRGRYGLQQLVDLLLPGRWAEFDSRMATHRARLHRCGTDPSLVYHVAKCRTDVEYTANVLRKIPSRDSWRNENERG